MALVVVGNRSEPSQKADLDLKQCGGFQRRSSIAAATMCSTPRLHHPNAGYLQPGGSACKLKRTPHTARLGIQKPRPFGFTSPSSSDPKFSQGSEKQGGELQAPGRTSPMLVYLDYLLVRDDVPHLRMAKS